MNARVLKELADRIPMDAWPANLRYVPAGHTVDGSGSAAARTAEPVWVIDVKADNAAELKDYTSAEPEGVTLIPVPVAALMFEAAALRWLLDEGFEDFTWEVYDKEGAQTLTFSAPACDPRKVTLEYVREDKQYDQLRMLVLACDLVAELQRGGR